MKPKTKTILKTLPLVLATVGFVSCDVEKTEEGEMPDVEVEGEMKAPEYDVDAPDVEVEKKEVEIPDSIEVPTIDVTPADEDTDDE